MWGTDMPNVERFCAWRQALETFTVHCRGLIAAVDIALWDLAGKKLNASVCELLGGYRKRLPAYASTYHGDHNGGLSSKEAFADFAQQCYEMGYRAFKIHGWNEGCDSFIWTKKRPDHVALDRRSSQLKWRDPSVYFRLAIHRVAGHYTKNRTDDLGPVPNC
jgi:L-alanine-DL-glutamate epimerase-like enolase superfamily enzyme